MKLLYSHQNNDFRISMSHIDQFVNKHKRSSE